MTAEAITRGFDPAAVMADLVFSSPDIEVVDVGCDLVNSEIMNLFLNATVITETFEADFDEAFDKQYRTAGFSGLQQTP